MTFAAITAGDLILPLLVLVLLAFVVVVLMSRKVTTLGEEDSEAKLTILDMAEDHATRQIAKDQGMIRALDALTLAMGVLERERNRLIAENKRLHERLGD